MDSRLIKLAEAAQERAGETMVDDFIASIMKSVETNNFDMVAAWRQYATLDKPVQDLTEDEKQQAFLNHVLEKSEDL